jgi:hypothetical protein
MTYRGILLVALIIAALTVVVGGGIASGEILSDNSFRENVERNSSIQQTTGTDLASVSLSKPVKMLPGSETQVDGELPNKDMNVSNEDIDSALVSLINSSNKDEFAEQNSINYRDGKVQVVLEMSEGATVPERYNVTTETTYSGQGKNLAQVRVPVSSLVSISEEEGIDYVRLPTRSDANTAAGGNEQPDGPEEDTSDSGDNVTQEPAQTDENNTRDGEGLGSVLGAVVPAILVILTTAYYRRQT